MKSERRMSAGWSFAAGTLFGGIAAFVPLSSHGTPGPRPEGPQPPRRVAAEPAGRTETPVARVSDEARAPDSVALRAPAQEDRRPTKRSVKSANPTPVHWECELLLD
jgi:hypothetical protein